jgi:hypothetical protein
MNDFSLLKLSIALDELVHILKDFRLSELLFDMLAEIRFAQFSDDVSVILGGEDIMQGEYVGDVLKFLQNLDF